jgi:phosphoglucomutase/phosphomannomutase
MTADSESRAHVSSVLDRLGVALADGLITPSAARNIRQWLTQAHYAPYAEEVIRHIQAARWRQLDDVFWTVIPFGTGGRRGQMYPIGCNAINDRTIGESARGLADYVKAHAAGSEQLACAIAFDTRHRSRQFARICAEVLVAAGYKVYLLAEIRSTPELSFLVRYKQCACGIMVTASHNPPSDNAVKCYWSTGGQLLPPHDAGVIESVLRVTEIPRADFDMAVREGKIELCLEEVDAAYLRCVAAQSFAGPRDLKVIYSPLHGVGAKSVVPALERDGFRDVEVFAPHAEPNGDFPNVPDNVANPENPAVFDAIIPRARDVGADIILATDPDADRLGCAAPVTTRSQGPWKTLTGNQLGALLADYVLEQRKKVGTLTPAHYVVTTLVTTQMIRRIATSYGVRTVGDLLVGFKWIGGVIDQQGPEEFVFGTEESHGYLAGHYARDKDGIVAAMLLAELAALAKSLGQSLHERLGTLYQRHGYHAERLITQKMPGSAGMDRMQALMRRFRESPPAEVGGMRVTGLRDYEHQVLRRPNGSTEPLAGPHGDLVIVDLAEEGNSLAARPSGTEPKVKFYLFTYVPPDQVSELGVARREMEARMDRMERDLREFAERS